MGPLSQMESTRSPCDTSVHFTLTGTPHNRDTTTIITLKHSALCCVRRPAVEEGGYKKERRAKHKDTPAKRCYS